MKHTVDGSEIPVPTTVWMYKTLYSQKRDIYHDPTGEVWGFLNHQQFFGTRKTTGKMGGNKNVSHLGFASEGGLEGGII